MRPHTERHFSERIGWLRAAVLGANDGIVSTGSLVIGVAAASASQSDVLLAGVAAWVAGAMSMAAGEYVSVSTQADTEKADLSRERHELETEPEMELQELAQIYVGRGLDSTLASQVAAQLMEHDALGAHARDELGMSTTGGARPIQAALASAATFTIGAALPLLALMLASQANMILVVAVSSLFFLTLLGYLSAQAGGANIRKGVSRVLLWGAAAMAATAGVGMLFESVI